MVSFKNICVCPECYPAVQFVTLNERKQTNNLPYSTLLLRTSRIFWGGVTANKFLSSFLPFFFFSLRFSALKVRDHDTKLILIGRMKIAKTKTAKQKWLLQWSLLYEKKGLFSDNVPKYTPIVLTLLLSSFVLLTQYFLSTVLVDVLVSRQKEVQKFDQVPKSVMHHVSDWQRFSRELDSFHEGNNLLEYFFHKTENSL